MRGTFSLVLLNYMSTMDSNLHYISYGICPPWLSLVWKQKQLGGGFFVSTVSSLPFYTLKKSKLWTSSGIWHHYNCREKLTFLLFFKFLLSLPASFHGDGLRDVVLVDDEQFFVVFIDAWFREPEFRLRQTSVNTELLSRSNIIVGRYYTQ